VLDLQVRLCQSRQNTQSMLQAIKAQFSIEGVLLLTLTEFDLHIKDKRPWVQLCMSEIQQANTLCQVCLLAQLLCSDKHTEAAHCCSILCSSQRLTCTCHSSAFRTAKPSPSFTPNKASCSTSSCPQFKNLHATATLR